jgi:hypothetical protein
MLFHCMDVSWLFINLPVDGHFNILPSMLLFLLRFFLETGSHYVVQAGF